MSNTAVTISNESSALGILERGEVLSLLAQQMAKLPEIQKKMLALYYHQNKTLSEIATHFGMTEGRTIEIHRQTVELLRNYVGNVLA
jgi:DNA-directed RNA polymerase specialized sigma subunit